MSFICFRSIILSEFSGNRYAMMLMKMFAVRYVSKFRSKTTKQYKDIKIKNGITIDLVGGFPISLAERNAT